MKANYNINYKLLILFLLKLLDSSSSSQQLPLKQETVWSSTTIYR